MSIHDETWDRCPHCGSRAYIGGHICDCLTKQPKPAKQILNTQLYNNLGYCTYRDHHGSDFRVVESARHSYGNPATKGDEKDKKLLRYLLKNRHTSPFEQCGLTLHIRMPIFVMRQFVRHRTFRLNEESARYTEMRDDFYVPTVWRAQDKKDKQKSNAIDMKAVECKEGFEQLSLVAENFCERAYKVYKYLLNEGVAREQARCILPVNLMTTICVNVDLHNLMHFLRLRLDSHAQHEIRVLAHAMFKIMGAKFPWTAEAFLDFNPKVADDLKQLSELSTK